MWASGIHLLRNSLRNSAECISDLFYCLTERRLNEAFFHGHVQLRTKPGLCRCYFHCSFGLCLHIGHGPQQLWSEHSKERPSWNTIFYPRDSGRHWPVPFGTVHRGGAEISQQSDEPNAMLVCYSPSFQSIRSMIRQNWEKVSHGPTFKLFVSKKSSFPGKCSMAHVGNDSLPGKCVLGISEL